ncbi:MAG: hypothetical protein JWL91_592 [Sphingomonas bacterium]|jgi:hypothetical protein|nr:TauD/TfdA family dioxygenase [Sphingomonas bacterium]MDB5688716.1 hypothetical protein [Sphingomonas bacterium]
MSSVAPLAPVRPAPASAFRQPATWTSAEIGGAEGLMHRLSPAQAAAMVSLARSLSGRPVESITREDVGDPEVLAVIAAIRFEIRHGKGGIVLSGIDADAITEDEFSRLFWALGTHLGRGVVQSSKRDLIGRVEKRKDNPEQRGYQLDIELGSHCDFHEILALGCYRKADSGGESGLCSSLAVHDEIAATRPDLLAALYQGFPHQSATIDDLSDHDVPVFCDVGGVISAYYHRLFYANAARETGRAIPPLLEEALQLFETLTRRPDIRATFLLQPGEMVFWHNFVNLHSRNSFTDRPEHRRLLFRLWLHAYDGEGRPMAADFTERARIMDRAHEQGRPGIIYHLDGMKE